MDSRDGFVGLNLYIPEELKYLVDRYQITTKTTTLSGTIRILLETHPALDKELRAVYAEAATSPMGE